MRYTIQQRAAEVIERLRAAYEHNRPEFDFHVSQFVDGENNKELRREIIRQATGVTEPLTKCGKFAVSNSLKNKFDQFELF